jgi:hypothetical protein
MIYQFKEAARVPGGVTADGVLAERERIKEKHGHANPEIMAQAVTDAPEEYPMLRSFGPADAEEAFRTVMRDRMAYAIRMIVPVTESRSAVPVRALILVTEDDGVQDYESFEVIAGSERMRNEIMDRLVRESDTYTRRLNDSLREIQRLTRLIPG